MLKSGCPKPLWDHFIELEALFLSHTALDIYGLEGQVPETVMSGQTGDISNLCEFEWFQWVMFIQPKETYPDNKMFIGIWLGPKIYVGPVMNYFKVRWWLFMSLKYQILDLQRGGQPCQTGQACVFYGAAQHLHWPF